MEIVLLIRNDGINVKFVVFKNVLMLRWIGLVSEKVICKVILKLLLDYIYIESLCFNIDCLVR